MSGLFGGGVPKPEPLVIEPPAETEADLTRDAEAEARRRAILRRARRRGVDTLTIDPIGNDENRLTI